MLTFIINNYITLKLENGKTNIYVKNDLFNQCKYLLINIDKKMSIDDLENKSIDEINNRHENKRHEITPEMEFWAHCSNLQAWSEHDYDTKLLHSNLSFELLKKLREVGDKKAKRAFKDEIAKRFLSCYPPILSLLIYEKYLDYLNQEEITYIIKELKRKNRFIYFLYLPILLNYGYYKKEYKKEEIKKLIKKVELILESDCIKLQDPEIDDIYHSVNKLKLLYDLI